MKSKIVILGVLVALLVSCKETEPLQVDDQKDDVTTVDYPEVDAQYRPLLQLFTSIHCGGCGRFGIPVSNAVAEQMGDSILMLPTHFKYNDVFINNSSLAIEKAFVKSYHSPQLWVNNQEHTYDILSLPQSGAIEYLKTKLRGAIPDDPEIYLGLEYQEKQNGRIDVKLSVENQSSDSATYYVEVYGMEDGLNEVQAGNDPYRRDHERVNRGGQYGGMGRKHTFVAGERFTDQFEYVPCMTCTKEQLYFYAIVWKSTGDGRFAYVNGAAFRK